MLAELGLRAPVLVASRRFQDLVAVDPVARFSELPAVSLELPASADSLLAIGGGSAIDTAKGASARSGLAVVSVPTTYSGAEWSHSFGVRSPDRLIRGGGTGAHLAAIVYDVPLTYDLPLALTVGTALNALAHCAEALYSGRRSPRSDERALEGARLISLHLPAVVAAPRDYESRRGLLRGAAAAGEALGLAGLALAHAIAQALGGSFGLPHGAMNALVLPPALRFNAALAPEQVARFGAAIGAPDDPVARVEELARLGGFGRLADFGIPAAALPGLAATAAARPGNGFNPRPATPAEIESLLRSIY